MMGFLSRIWNWASSFFRPKKLPVIRRPFRGDDYLKEVINYIESDVFKETPYTILVVPTVREREYLARELTDMGWKTTEVVPGKNGSVAMQNLCTNADMAYFYVMTMNLACVGWYTGIYGAAMMCFGHIGWERFVQLRGRCRNNGTFYASGRFHQIKGVPVPH